MPADFVAFCAVICLVWMPGLTLCNPSVEQAEDTCVYSFQVPRQDSHAACSDSVSLDQQLLKTMVLSLQRQVTELQQHLVNTQGGRYMFTMQNVSKLSNPPQLYVWLLWVHLINKKSFLCSQGRLLAKEVLSSALGWESMMEKKLVSSRY